MSPHTFSQYVSSSQLEVEVEVGFEVGLEVGLGLEYFAEVIEVDFAWAVVMAGLETGDAVPEILASQQLVYVSESELNAQTQKKL